MLSKLNAEDLQDVVLMVGSKSAFAQYFNLDAQALTAVWSANRLKTPMEWVQGLTPEAFTSVILTEGSYHKAAERLGVSVSTLTKLYRPARRKVEQSDVIEAVKKYQSVRLTAWRLKIKEADVRSAIKASGLLMADLVTYAGSAHNNAKGRRAELFFAEIRGSQIKADLNDEEGSKAPYDFDDVSWSKVNVKSGVRQRLKSKTRGGAPHFWKFSSVGKDACDYFACVGYDEKHVKPYIVVMLPKGWLTKADENSFYLHMRMDGEVVFRDTILPTHYILYRWS